MVVDDDGIDRRTIERSLRQVGFEAPVLEARSGLEALQILDRLSSNPSPGAALPGLILLDINMPRMSGIETLAELRGRQALRAIPAIILSTSCQPSEIEQSYQQGAAAYFIKPVDLSGFRDLVRTLVSFLSLSERPG